MGAQGVGDVGCCKSVRLQDGQHTQAVDEILKEICDPKEDLFSVK